MTLRFAAPRAHSCSHYNAFCSITWQTRLHLRTWQQKMTTIMQSPHCDLQPQIPSRPITITMHAQTHPKQLEATATLRQRKNTRMIPARTAHTSCPSSPAAALLHGKTQCFAPRLPPHNKPHAAFMQPVDCVLQHHVANPLVSTHMATEDGNNHAAIPLRSAAADSKPPLKPPLH